MIEAPSSTPRSFPVPFDPVPAAVVMSPASGDPGGVRMRAPFPASRDPYVARPVPPMESLDPDMVGTRCDSPDLDSDRGRPDPHEDRSRRRRHEACGRQRQRRERGAGRKTRNPKMHFRPPSRIARFEIQELGVVRHRIHRQWPSTQYQPRWWRSQWPGTHLARARGLTAQWPGTHT